MGRPTFPDSFAFLSGIWVSVAVAFVLSWQSKNEMRAFPEKFSAETVAAFNAIRFARTIQVYPPSGSEETLEGVRWRIVYEAAPGGADTHPAKTSVTLVAESLPAGHTSTYTFQRAIP